MLWSSSFIQPVYTLCVCVERYLWFCSPVSRGPALLLLLDWTETSCNNLARRELGHKTKGELATSPVGPPAVELVWALRVYVAASDMVTFFPAVRGRVFSDFRSFFLGGFVNKYIQIYRFYEDKGQRTSSDW